MRINRYRLKSDTTLEDIEKLQARPGGSWIVPDSRYFIHKFVEFNTGKSYSIEFSIDIAFKENIQDWDDFRNILVLDDDFGQPYTPFYHHYEDDVTDFPILIRLIEEYNKFMDSLSIFERVL